MLQELMGMIVDAEAKEAKGERWAPPHMPNQTSIRTKLLFTNKASALTKPLCWLNVCTD